MGVKIFWTITIFWISPRCLLLLHHDTFVFHRRFIFSALHDRLISTEMPSFPRLRQDSLFLPRRLLLLRHNIYDFTTMPSFVVPRYFGFYHAAFFCCTTILLISPSRHSLMRHNIYDFTTISCSKFHLTPLFSCAAIGSTDVGTPQKFGRSTELEIMTRWLRQRATRR